MIKKLLVILITTLALTFNVNASSDGELLLKKNEPAEVEDCFEGFNRASFALNQGLDKIIFKPVASVYRVLPSPVKTGVSNSLDNLSNVVTIPNNILQGEFSKAGINTGRFIINTTVGVLGLIDVATYLGFDEYEKECQAIIEKGFALPAYDYCLKCSHTFNVLDARGAISVTERMAYILRIRKCAQACATAYLKGIGELEEVPA